MTARNLRMALLGLAILAGLAVPVAAADAGAQRVLCTTFPIYQITRNVTQGRDAVTVSLLLPAELGCRPAPRRL